MENNQENSKMMVVKAKIMAILQLVKEKAPVYWQAFRAKTIETWNAGRKGKAICIGIPVALVLVIWMASGGSDEQAESDSAVAAATSDSQGVQPSGDSQSKNETVAAGTQNKPFSGESPIEGLMGYKLGEEYTGKLGSKAVLVGPDWYSVTNRAEFHNYATCIKILPKSRKICGIYVHSTKMGINIKDELNTVEVMLTKKYPDIDLQEYNDYTVIWRPKTGARVLLTGIMQHPMGACVKIEVRDLELEALVEKEHDEIDKQKALREAEAVGDVL